MTASGCGTAITVDGVTFTVAEWSQLNNLAPNTITARLRSGWDPERAVTEPAQKTNKPHASRFEVPDGAPGSWTWYSTLLRFERDPFARRFVIEHPDGATSIEVGAAMGLGDSQVRDIEASALQKLRALLASGSPDARTFLEALCPGEPDDFESSHDPAHELEDLRLPGECENDNGTQASAICASRMTDRWVGDPSGGAQAAGVHDLERHECRARRNTTTLEPD